MENAGGEEQFYMRVRGKVQGPFTRERLQVLARRGRFGRMHEVSTDRVTWHRAKDFPELFPEPAPRERRKKRRQQPHTIEPAEIASAPAELVPVDEESTYGLEASQGAPKNADVAERLWYYSQDMKERGPVSHSELLQLATSGRLSADDLVWTEGMKDWVQAETVPELSSRINTQVEGIDFVLDEPEAPRDPGTTASSGPTTTAPMSVASLVLGLLSTILGVSGAVTAITGYLTVAAILIALTFLAAVLGVVFGHVASKQIKISQRTLGGQGMALAGLITGYSVLVVLVVTGLVLSILVALGISIAVNL